MPASTARAGLIPNRFHTDTNSRREIARGKKNHLDHEGVRARRCQPSHHLQLALGRENRIRPHRGRLGPHLRRFAMARSASHRPSRPRGGVAGGRAESGLAKHRRLSRTTDCRAIRRRNRPTRTSCSTDAGHQCGLIVCGAHAEPLEVKDSRRATARAAPGRHQRAQSDGDRARRPPPERSCSQLTCPAAQSLCSRPRAARGFLRS